MTNYCQEIEKDLPLYNDGALDAGLQAAIGEHLDKCPLCRIKTSEFRDLKIGMRTLQTEFLPASRLAAIRSAVGGRVSVPVGFPVFALIDGRRNWLQTWILPSSFGGL
ncbi:MAG: anti-sigma factor, partial [Pyrinomonadaceae bacterium]